ncbi:Arylsulfatase [Rubripirellula tenax]|uniref:Arylsulfatase n=1 Tax=Rubripirellula tenax TaxID=2528015 RepID=A0A5C6FAL1_9BACT|nr:sulfatase [Rubripirellula tenax]TWU56639.1 Arylsulfatase [Rubripirellula tenax]
MKNSRRIFGFGFYPVFVFALTAGHAVLISQQGFSQTPAQPPTAAKRPNIVWIMSEDNSADYLRHFDQDGAVAPRIEAMASAGITFDHAFSNAPVCSVARTTLITSCYGPRIGTQFHRRIRTVPMPPGLRMFPAYLRDGGYYTSNHSKEDYNAVRAGDVWDDSSKRASWKNRPSDATPFFHVETFADSHESRLHFPASDVESKPTETDPSSVGLPPYFPDQPVFRYSVARYHDRMADIDRLVGKVLDELSTAGQLENTFVFYFGDHGGVLPRSKGYVFESGLHVPLVVRVPENFKGLVDRSRGDRAGGFVEFVDFGPTVLNLAGITPPQDVDGKPFLGPGVAANDVDRRNEAFGYADRFDEKYDLVRTIRVGNLKYVRNFEPYYPDGMLNAYRYRMAAYQQWRKLHEEGRLDPVQDQFFQPKPTEALYDLDSDPDEVNNLADDPSHAADLVRLRNRLVGRLKAMPDLSFFPEAVLSDDEIGSPTVFGQANKEAIADLIDIANLAAMPWAEAEPKLRIALDSQDPWSRYWALAAAASFGKTAASLLPQATARLQDLEPIVVARAAEFVAIVGDQDPRPYVIRALERATSEAEALQILNSAVYLNDHTDGRFPIHFRGVIMLFKVDPKSDIQLRLDHLGS